MKKNLIYLLLTLPFFAAAQGEWNIINAGTSNDLATVHFVQNTDIVLAGGENGTLLKSLDGGINWQNISLNDTTRYIRSIAATSPDTILIVTSAESGIFGQATVWQSIDGGLSWTDISGVSTQCFPVQVVPHGHEFVIVDAGCFASPYFIRYRDGQMLNNTFTSGFFQGMVAAKAYFPSYNVGYAVSETSGLISKTTDGGNTWLPIFYRDSTAEFYDVYFVDENNGIVCGRDTSQINWAPDVLFQTTDGGNTWTSVYGGLFVTPIVSAVDGLDMNHLLAVGNVSQSFPNENGLVLTNFYTNIQTAWGGSPALPFINSYVPNDIAHGISNCFVAVGNNGLIFQKCNVINPTQELSLPEQNVVIYPNPTSGEVYLKPVNSTYYPLTVRLFNLSGQLVQEEIIKQPSEHILNIANKGVYCLQILSNGHIIIAKNILKE